MSETFPRPFGRYTLLANLAQGGMGALYLACQGEPGLEKLCVIKTVLPHLADKEYVARFRDEAKVVVRLSHGNLVPVFDAGLAKVDGAEEMYLAMEHVDGKDLRAVWNRCAKKGLAFPVDVAVYIARELARGLHHAHSTTVGGGTIKLVHRDVSPPNVLVSFAGEVKLTDFGLASSTMKTEKTAPGVVYGKVSYMSPEQARAEPLDGRTDMYAVAIILWELLTGKPLFPQQEQNLINRVRDPEIPPPSKHAGRVPAALDLIVSKALAKDRTLRYADCEAFRAALSGFLAQTAPTTDNDRVAGFLAQLFGGEIEEERRWRQGLLDKLAEERAAVKEEVGSKQTFSQPETISLAPLAPQKTSNGLVGDYLDAKYLVKRLIGEGGMGLVYEAEHVDIGRRVAVKILHAAYTRQAEVVARFRAEARAATRIGNPHIVEVFDSGTTVEGAVYFVMEFLEGQDLASLILREKRLPPERAVAILREVCQALAAAHKAGIVHRDMKPENIFLIARDGRRDFVKVLDFGIAKTLEQASDRAGRLTSPGMAMGTPEYMAPEQAAGGPIDHRADIYALGAILYEMLSGRPPYQGANIMEVLTKKATQLPTPLAQLRPELPRGIDKLVMRMLATAPGERPPSMVALDEELERLGLGPAPREPVASQVTYLESTDRVPQSRPAWPLVGAAAAALLIGSMAWLVARNRAPAASEASASQSATASAAGANRENPGHSNGENGRNEIRGNSAAGEKPEAPAAERPEGGKAEPEKEGEKAEPEAAAPKPVIAVRPVTVHPAAPRPPRAASTSPTATAAPAQPAAPAAPAPSDREAQKAEAKRWLVDARAALDAGRYAEAEALFQKVQASGFERGAAITGLSAIAFQRQNYPEAVRLGRRAVDAGGGVGAKMVLGNAYFKLQRWDDAISEYRDVLKVDAGHSEAQSNLAAAERLKR